MSANQVDIENDPSPDRHRYRLLLDITELVARAKTLPEAFKALAGPVLDITGGELLNLSVHDPSQNSMLMQYWKKNEENGSFDAPVDQAATGWVWKNQESIAITDIQREQRFPGCVPVLLTHGIRSYTVIPISTSSSHIGALGLGKTTPEVPNGEDIVFLSRLALMAALALEKELSHRAFEEQQSLFAISRELNSGHELEDLLPVILSSLRGIARYERSVLCLLDEDGKGVRPYGGSPDWAPDLNNGDAIPLAKSLAARAVETRKPITFDANDLRNMNDPLGPAMFKAGIQEVRSVPLIAGDRVWGALHTTNSDEDAFHLSEMEYLLQVANQIAAALQNAHTFREIVQLKERLAHEKRYLEYEIQNSNRSNEIIGKSSALKHVLNYAGIVADTDTTVLITGETGTGKERIARLIHGMSRRKDRNFIKLNCAAIPTGLLESELFGHERGAFTGAVSQKLGRLELADKGTLLLDEIGEIPLELQPKLLRLLQDQEFEHLGGNKTIRVDVRLIAATNRDLAKAVEEKEFRGDLFYRLHVFPLHVPALRERPEDIPMLVRHFVSTCAGRLHKTIDVIPDEVIQALMQWRWPGNIRELENFIERSVILSEGNRLTPPLSELHDVMPRERSDSEGTLREKEREHIVDLLRQTRGVLSGPTGAAARLGLKRTTLQYKMQRLGISRMDYLN